MGLQGIERRLERLVEGVFARAFRSELRPVELGRRIVREMDLHMTIGVRGEKIAPNHHTIRLSPEDHERFTPFLDALASELADAVEQHATDERFDLKGPATVELVADERQHVGQFQVTSAIVSGPRAAAPTAWLQLPDGSSVAVNDHDPIVIGRMPECDIVVNDANVSRQHAEVRTVGGRPSIIDLESLNGTKLNGRGVPADRYGFPLADGDRIQVGSMVIRFVGTADGRGRE